MPLPRSSLLFAPNPTPAVPSRYSLDQPTQGTTVPSSVYGAAIQTARRPARNTKNAGKTEDSKRALAFEFPLLFINSPMGGANFFSPPTARRLASLFQPTVAAKILTSLHRKALFLHGP